MIFVALFIMKPIFTIHLIMIAIAAFSHNSYYECNHFDGTLEKCDSLSLIPKADRYRLLSKKNVKIDLYLDKADDQQTADLHVLLKDPSSVDNDLVDVFLDGVFILENYSTTGSKKDLLLHLKPGIHVITLYPPNRGYVGPNTAEVILKAHHIKYKVEMYRSHGDPIKVVVLVK